MLRLLLDAALVHLRFKREGRKHLLRADLEVLQLQSDLGVVFYLRQTPQFIVEPDVF